MAKSRVYLSKIPERDPSKIIEEINARKILDRLLEEVVYAEIEEDTDISKLKGFIKAVKIVVNYNPILEEKTNVYLPKKEDNILGKHTFGSIQEYSTELLELLETRIKDTSTKQEIREIIKEVRSLNQDAVMFPNKYHLEDNTQYRETGKKDIDLKFEEGELKKNGWEESNDFKEIDGLKVYEKFRLSGCSGCSACGCGSGGG